MLQEAYNAEYRLNSFLYGDDDFNLTPSNNNRGEILVAKTTSNLRLKMIDDEMTKIKHNLKN